MARGVGVEPGYPWSGSEIEGEHTSNPMAGPPNLYENGGFHGLAGTTAFEAMRSRVDHYGVVRGRFIAHPLDGPHPGSHCEPVGEDV
jgi:type 1 glutamine amidotransferase